MNLLPKLKQFSEWSLPSKYAFIGIILTIIFGVLSILFYVYPNEKNYNRYEGGLFSAKSNILDVYFNNKEPEFKFNINNSSKNVWNNIEVYGFISMFANEMPHAPNSFAQFFQHNYSHLASNDEININVSKSLLDISKQLFNINENYRNMVFNPYLVKNIKEKQSFKNQHGDNHFILNKYISDIFNNHSNMKLPFITKSKYGGFITLFIVKFNILDNNNLKTTITKVIPFINMWHSSKKDITQSSDIGIMNTYIKVNKELIEKDNLQILKDSTSNIVYNIQDFLHIKHQLKKEGALLDVGQGVLKDSIDESMKFYIFIIIGQQNMEYLYPKLKPSIIPSIKNSTSGKL